MIIYKPAPECQSGKAFCAMWPTLAAECRAGDDLLAMVRDSSVAAKMLPQSNKKK